MLTFYEKNISRYVLEDWQNYCMDKKKKRSERKKERKWTEMDEKKKKETYN